MDAHKVKIRIGQHEFEAEGSEDAVDRRLAIFKELVERTGEPTPASAQTRSAGIQIPKREQSDTSVEAATVDNPLASLFKIEGKTVSLVTPPQGQGREGDAFLLLLLGHRIMRAADWVLVGDVKAGLIDSGFSVTLVDTITGTVAGELYMRKGQKRGKQFRLTNPGLLKAQALAEEVLASIS